LFVRLNLAARSIRTQSQNREQAEHETSGDHRANR
jgi:hypothetical protein